MPRLWVVCVVSLGFFIRTTAAQYQIIEPDPYRGTESEERSFSYDEQSFIDRFTYRFDPEDVLAWQESGEGLRVTGGSVSRDEMYLIAQFKKQWFVNERVFATFRYQKDEDFDARYNRELFGPGITFGEGWSLTVMSDLQPEKRDTDLQVELEWESRSNSSYGQSEISNDELREHFRLALVLVDPFYNEKSDAFFYEEKPYTIFGEGRFQLLEQGWIHGWINWNTETEFRKRDSSSTFSYKQREGGILFSYGSTADSIVFTSLKGQVGERRWDTAPEGSRRELERDNLVVDLELRTALSLGLRGWVGARYFILNEDVNALQLIPTSDLMERDESYLHFGVLWSISDTLTFRPGVYFNFLEESSERQGTFLKTSSTRETETGRVTFPLQIDFPHYNSRFTVNPTLEWPGHPFGGLGIQLVVQL